MKFPRRELILWGWKRGGGVAHSFDIILPSWIYSKVTLDLENDAGEVFRCCVVTVKLYRRRFEELYGWNYVENRGRWVDEVRGGLCSEFWSRKFSYLGTL